MNSQYIMNRFVAPAFLMMLFILPPAAASPAPWPASNREPDGVLWYWGTQTLTGNIVDAEDQWTREGEALFRDQARPVWFRGVAPDKGYLEAADVGPALAQALDETPGIHLEAALHPPADTSPPLIFFRLKTFENHLIWQLVFRNHALWIERPAHEPVRLADLKLTRPVHFAITLNNDSFILWINGEVHLTNQSENLLPVFEDPWDVIAAFGGSPEGHSVWTGAMEYLLIGTQPHAVAQHADAWKQALEARTAPATHTVAATLDSHAREPQADELSEYGEALLAAVWTLEAPLGDDLVKGDRVFVWHWYVLDTRVFPDTRPPAVGTRHTLSISPAADQPQLEGVQQLVEGVDPEDLLLLPDFLMTEGRLPPANLPKENP